MLSNKSELVRSAYDQICLDYDVNRTRFDNSRQLEFFTRELSRSKGKRSKVLDAGCGSGVIIRFLQQQGFEPIGIDLSKGMLNLAREKMRSADLLEMDMTDLSFKPASFCGVVCTYALIHVPRKIHREILQNFFYLLERDGCALISTGSTEWECIEEYKPYSVRNYWSHFQPDWYVKTMRGIGFRIEYEELLEQGGESHYWIIGRKS